MLSYHGAHSRGYCCHADDLLEDILDTYAAAGYKFIGVTEHLPSQNGFLYPEEEPLGPLELDKRFKQLMDIRPLLHKKYDRLFSDFRIGFETEYYGKDPLGRIANMIEMYQPEIVVASLHHVNDVPVDFEAQQYREAIQKCGSLHALFSTYYDQQNDLIRFLSKYSGTIPLIVGHMDLIKLFPVQLDPGFTPSEEIADRIKRNITAAIAGGLVFEVNIRGIKKGVGPYPDSKILKLIADQGGQITFGDDSHQSKDVGLFYPAAKAIAGEFFSKAVTFRSTPGGGYAKHEIPF
jgi:histidinol-phosphatase (PHP family)